MRLTLHCYVTDMGTSLSSDFVVSFIFITFTSYMNKSYKSTV